MNSLRKRIVIFCFALLVAIAGCRTDNSAAKKPVDYSGSQIVGTTAVVSFAPDGKLWRLIPTQDTVYVDYSTDLGKTFSGSIKVNKTAQKISAWPENPPAISIGPSGEIYVLYYADETQKATTFFSFSDDHGKTFSNPVLVSDQAKTDMHYMDKMLVTGEGKVYLFWHDTRHDGHNNKLGAGVLSLFYSVTEAPQFGHFSNEKITGSVCSCCRTAIAKTPLGLPVVLMRTVQKNGVRDHGLMRMKIDGNWTPVQRITQDDWTIDACPEHGPALSIDANGRSHFTWFTQGDKRRGIYYAYTDDYGKTVSQAMPLGNKERLPGHADVLAIGDRVLLSWKEFDGAESSVIVKESIDRGETWSEDRKITASTESSGYPTLVSNGREVFLSWTSWDQGHQIIELN